MGMSGLSAPSKRLTVREIAAIAAGLYGMAPEDVLGSSARRKVAHIRMRAMWAAKQLDPERSLNQIGRPFRRHHTTVIHALRKVEGLREKDVWARICTDLLLAECHLVATLQGWRHAAWDADWSAAIRRMSEASAQLREQLEHVGGRS